MSLSAVSILCLIPVKNPNGVAPSTMTKNPIIYVLFYSILFYSVVRCSFCFGLQVSHFNFKCILFIFILCMTMLEKLYSTVFGTLPFLEILCALL